MNWLERWKSAFSAPAAAWLSLHAPPVIASCDHVSTNDPIDALVLAQRELQFKRMTKEQFDLAIRDVRSKEVGPC